MMDLFLTSMCAWGRHICLFCRRPDGSAHTLWLKFTPSLLASGTPGEVSDALGTDGISFRVKSERLTSAFGFEQSGAREMTRVSFMKRSEVRRGASILKETMKVMHEGWPSEQQFLHETGLSLNGWLTLKRGGDPLSGRMRECLNVDSRRVRRLHTTCEMSDLCSSNRKTEPPLVFMYIRMRAFSESSTPKSLKIPDAGKRPDCVSHILTKVQIKGGGVSVGNVSEERKMADQCVKTFYLAHTLGGDMRRREVRLIKSLATYIAKVDPDIFVVHGDSCCPVQYLYTRNTKRSIFCRLMVGDPMDAEKQSEGSRQFQPSDFLRVRGREVVDLRHCLMKQQFKPKLDGYTLGCTLSHPNLLRRESQSEFRSVSDHVYERSVFLENEKVLEQLRLETDLMVALENQRGVVSEFMAISTATDVRLTDVVCRGQQVRVWSRMTRCLYQKGLYVDRDHIKTKILILPMDEKNTTYPDPGFLRNVPLQGTESGEEEDGTGRGSKRGVTQLNLFGDKLQSETDAIDEFKQNVKIRKKSQSQSQGGKVMRPHVGMYRGNAVVTFDFASLYPSIIQGYSICYMRLLLDTPSHRRILEDPRAVVEYIPLNSSLALPLVKTWSGRPVPTFLPQMVGEVVQERQRVRAEIARLKGEGRLGRFQAATLNARQLSCKVLQNAVYGFLGVEKNARFSCRYLMSCVCAIGRFMITLSRYRAITDMGAFVVYGDTDSIMVQIPPDGPLQREQLRPSQREGVRGYASQLSDLDLHRICTLFSERVSKLFPSPNLLECEDRKKPHLQIGRKQYICLVVPFLRGSWGDMPKLVMKGVSILKRDRCMWVRRMGPALCTALLNGSEDDFVQILRQNVEHLVAGRLDYEDLSISCCIGTDYKNRQNIQLFTRDLLQLRTGHLVPPMSRISYVVLCKPGVPFWQRGEDPKWARRNGSNLDREYYVKKQLLPAIVQLLCASPKMRLRVMEMLGAVLVNIRNQDHHQRDIRTFFKRAKHE